MKQKDTKNCNKKPIAASLITRALVLFTLRSTGLESLEQCSLLPGVLAADILCALQLTSVLHTSRAKTGRQADRDKGIKCNSTFS
ncbi:hypothetical protein L596_003673 [Steinernema carpocapsae]|uniref:Uncharacterized protein n=1 Tax=Steinernema carpocapsae TaxID=34508 RepID=A0A4U8UXC0_STECR|nr:hypothetical protein L596_003673 [Steinernema carpocapsae]